VYKNRKWGNKACGVIPDKSEADELALELFFLSPENPAENASLPECF